jgi:hypothetical protein
MHAIVGSSEIDASRAEEAVQLLNNGILPGISQAPGFVRATFARSADGTTGHSMIVFESEEAANAVAATAGDRLPPDAPVRIISLEVYEVVANA